MSLGSQSGKVQAVGSLTGIAHEVFAQGVKWHVLANSPTAQLFKKAQRNNEYKLQGEALVGAAQLSFAGGAGAFGSGYLPDHQYRDAKQWQTTPVRRYKRIALDNFTAARVSGPGAFKDFTEQVFDQTWDDWGRMTIRHSIGNSYGILCKIDARTSSTVFSVKDGYGHTGTHPLLHLEPGMVIAWYDVSGTAIAGAAKISSINYSTKAITVDSGATWEPSATAASGDYILVATTPSISADYFDTEYEDAPHGLMGIIDPDSTYTTVLNIAESGNERWKPFRETSATFDQFEVTEHWRKLRAKSTSPVGPSTHTVITHGAVVAELARTLGPFQQQSNLGRTFEGGYQAVRIAGMDFVEDDYSLHDVMFTVCTEDLYRGDLDGEEDFAADDGSMWSRLPDQDGKEAYVREYMQTWSDRRNRHGALKGISLPNVTEDDFTPVPS